jgi:hypothetical protein
VENGVAHVHNVAITTDYGTEIEVHHGIKDGDQVNHGMIVVGLAYTEPRLANMAEITGGTPYGTTTLAGIDGLRQPTENEPRHCALPGQARRQGADRRPRGVAKIHRDLREFTRSSSPTIPTGGLRNTIGAPRDPSSRIGCACGRSLDQDRLIWDA